MWFCSISSLTIMRRNPPSLLSGELLQYSVRPATADYRNALMGFKVELLGIKICRCRWLLQIQSSIQLLERSEQSDTLRRDRTLNSSRPGTEPESFAGCRSSSKM